MSTQLRLTKDVNGFNAYGLQWHKDGGNIQLPTITNTTITCPNSFENWAAIFSIQPGSLVFVNINATAVIPAGSFTTDTSELNPTMRQINGGDVINLITPDTSAFVGVYFYVLLNQ